MTHAAGLVTVDRVLVRSATLAVFRGEGADRVRRRYAWHRPTRPPCVGESWHVEGEVEHHPLHGPQIQVTSMTPARPQGRLLRHLLAGERFPGVGESTANRLCDAMPADDLIAVLDAGDGGALRQVLGDRPRAEAQIETILTEWPLVEHEPQLIAWFERNGVPPHIASKALACYGADTLRLLTDDPYRLLAFAGWKTIDPVARAAGIAPDDPRRQVAAVEAALHDDLGTGATVMGTDALRKAVGGLLGAEKASAALDAARRHKAVVERPSGWQAAGPALMEEAVAARIAHEIAADTPQPSLLGLPIAQVTRARSLNGGQEAAMRMALSERFSLVTGGAGTGKTTMLGALHDAAAEAGVPIEMMALSGRAALRMREATGGTARTIAGWLALLERGKLELAGAPLIVIDEASMVDLGSLYRIMAGAPDSSRFLLIGDDGQLPPVGFGLTLHALLGLPEIPRVHLTEVMRQAAETGIPAFAAAVRDGVLPDMAIYEDDASTGVSIAACAEGEVAATAVAIRRALGDARIVGSVKGTSDPATGGTVAMNALLHRAWIEAKGLAPTPFARGEPVMWTVNDYDLELWNGSLGRVAGEVEDGLAVHFDEGDRIIPHELLNNLDLAWVITTHKAQGSSFDIVVVPVTRSRLLDRTLLYTAVTRARRQVILVGDVQVIAEAVRRPPSASRRLTWLEHAVRTVIAPTTGQLAA